MSMGHKGDDQAGLFLTYKDVPRSAGHPFYQALDKVLHAKGFDRFVERECERFYSPIGRPSLAPGVYFRCLLIGYFEGIDSERGIAWRVADSLSLRDFLGLGMTKSPPDHSTLSRTRRLLDVEVHHRVFTWVLTRLAEAKLVRGRTIGVDATTLEANAALRSLVKRDDGQGYQDYLVELAKAEGIENPTQKQLAQLDRKRPKKGSNAVWVNPNDPDATISKMKSGATKMAHKAEHAVDMEAGAIVGVTVHGGTTHDTKSLDATLEMAATNLGEVQKEVERKRDNDDHDGPGSPVVEDMKEVVADAGYHSNKVMTDLVESELRSYIAEPKRGRRNWKGKAEEKKAVHANRRRTKGARGRRLMRQRGELLERPFAHLYTTGGLRRVHLRRHDNILKRLLIHAGGFNLSLLMRKLVGVGSPRSLQGRLAAFLWPLLGLLDAVVARVCLEVGAGRLQTVELAAVG
ncbi:transposase, IS5 family, truncation [Plesiocystis pacifica SIR-1]|uniref:Transposase, IS5 family, truncation n=1 Tax=Plesiocystis pacifica SIR-1 TaxID=391625 RepID=A6G145_9BACT|nr:transposase [Plesiocystis pacifica]EDM77045.1 transposase, IS5 family, truncation [Plesiocystis pacifica SIR-1]EDM80340.1 transposase, IS5 family, truncation [Plesiocystis pacifica SIR-1]